MHVSIKPVFVFLALALVACDREAQPPQAAAAKLPDPPRAVVKPHTVESPNGNRVDNYYWLRDDERKNPEVLGYLNAENAYKDAVLKPLEKLREDLYKEIVARIPAQDSTVPAVKRGYWYYLRFEEGKDQPIFARKKGSLDAPEEILIDGNKRAVGHEFFHVGAAEPSMDSKVIAFTEDLVGRRQYSLKFIDIATGRELPVSIDNVEPDIAWLADNRSVLYIEKDPKTLLSTRIRKHVIGTDPKDDKLLYEESDKAYYIGLRNSKSGRYALIDLWSTEATESRFVDSKDSASTLQVFFPREQKHLYSVEHLDKGWVVRTNWQAPNYRIMSVRPGEEGKRTAWRDVIPHREDVFVDEFDVFKDFVAIGERTAGVRRLHVRSWDGKKDEVIGADEPAYTAMLGDNYEADSNVLRYVYTSFTTPNSTYDYDLKSDKRELRKREEVVGNFNHDDYATELVWATVRDGTKVPVSIGYRKGFTKDGKAPLLQMGYGAYGASYDTEFSSPLLSLLDRGVVVAIAHIRGGQEMGRRWYEAGRQQNKMHSFTDFIDVTRFLVKEGYAAKDRVAAYGGSAGGLLMGSVVNMAPQDYKLIVAAVPFVDAVTTMLDNTIPLTSNEYDEWGNPEKPADYRYILSYSPYDNVKAQAYPSMFVTTGLWDSQVQYWEPAKWVAKLRATKTDQNPLLFRVDMGAGHGGKPGRFERQRERAEWYAFLLHELGVVN